MKYRISGYILMLLLLLVGFLNAETYVKRVTTVEAIDPLGRADTLQVDTSEVWLGENAIATYLPNNTTLLLRVDRGEYYVIDHGTKSYELIPVTIDGDVLKSEKPSLPDSLKEGLMVPTDVIVTPTDERESIHGWQSKRYLVDVEMSGGGKCFTEMWTSSDIPLDGRLYKFLNDAVTCSTPGYDNMLTISRETDGIPVRIINTFLVSSYTNRSTTELVECSEMPGPPDIFELPEGYTASEDSMTKRP